ncbi:uncharacterized protein LOC119097803 [Pollicipes pollicipes]|uniref:uncharacterized protein LOC119097803 n=1 Tax=Pollicipes pollicipes TaxID=41117 RepID=UPI001884F95C|nr:uncharacterized protein LOC119097803 [Pollicipes pollicipes]
MSLSSSSDEQSSGSGDGAPRLYRAAGPGQPAGAVWTSDPPDSRTSSQSSPAQLAASGGGRAELVLSLLQLLRSADHQLVSSTLLTMTSSTESCAALREPVVPSRHPPTPAP